MFPLIESCPQFPGYTIWVIFFRPSFEISFSFVRTFCHGVANFAPSNANYDGLDFGIRRFLFNCQYYLMKLNVIEMSNLCNR